MVRPRPNNQDELRAQAASGAKQAIESTSPLLIGVRHHSAVLARSIDKLLDDFQPKSLLVELPSDLQDWIEFIGDPSTTAPIALSIVTLRGDSYFYPLADFSPELVAIRWAQRNAVPVVACDLAISAIDPTEDDSETEESQRPSADSAPEQPKSLRLDDILRTAGDEESGALWQRMVESPGLHESAEKLRRAALLFGWVVRETAGPVSRRDLIREATMRQAIRAADKRSCAIVGSFHSPALTPELVASQRDLDTELLSRITTDEAGVSLIPYSFEQFDQRSGYPAGILDPHWHQRAVQSESREQFDASIVDLATEICRNMRRDGHVAGTPDATEIIRMTRDLARLRGLKAPGRGEFVEAVQSCLVQGDLHGRGRAVSAASFPVLVGQRQGTITDRAPRCGLVVSLERDLQHLGLPGEDSLTSSHRPASKNRGFARRNAGNFVLDHEKELRLDVLRNPRDRAKSVVLERLCTAGIPYARRLDEGGTKNRENLIERWAVAWQQSTSATVNSLARYGTTLEQVVAAIMRRSEDAKSDHAATDAIELPRVILRRLAVASKCGLAETLQANVARIDSEFRTSASLTELVDAASQLRRIATGHSPGAPLSAEDAYPPILRHLKLPGLQLTVDKLFRDCFERLADISGSNKTEDVYALRDLLALVGGKGQEDSGQPAGVPQLASWCRRTVRDGSNLMAGACTAALRLLEIAPEEQFLASTSGWVTAAAGTVERKMLRHRLAGATHILLSHMQNDPQLLGGVSNAIADLDDDRFLQRLPSLRGAFTQLAPSDRQRLLETQLSVLEIEDSQLSDALPAEQIALLRTADLAGLHAVHQVQEFANLLSDNLDSGLSHDGTSQVSERVADTHAGKPQDTATQAPIRTRTTDAHTRFSLADRWRLILGTEPESQDDRVVASARSLDDLFTRGKGEGARGDLGGGSSRGGRERPRPTTLQWADELEELFGSDVCQEVLGESAASGNAAAVSLLDPDSVTPSVDLLQQVLQLAGAVPEAKTEQLRRIARRITEQLAEELSVRLKPATHGLATPRPTRRRSRRLNLRRTVTENLSRCRRDPQGRPRLIAEDLIFDSQAHRSMDWHLTFVVDVSTSMSASVIYSALTAAIFDSLPAVSVRFLAFSTEVIDLSGQVGDPLSLLLGVQIGGGTDIGLGLRAARAGISVPTRSLVVVVSDFEEGVSVGRMLAEVRELVDCGVKCLGLAALDDGGNARFHGGLAQMVASAGMPVAAVSPDRLAKWVGDQIRNA